MEISVALCQRFSAAFGELDTLRALQKEANRGTRAH
jgi:hypothetical protein